MTEKPTRQEHEEAIRARAHDYWEKEAQPDSRHLEHWLKAEEELGRLDPHTKAADGAIPCQSIPLWPGSAAGPNASGSR